MFRNTLVVRVLLAIVIGAFASTVTAKDAFITSINTPKVLANESGSAVVPLVISLSSAQVIGGSQITATIALSVVAASPVEITLRSSNNEVARFGGTFGTIGVSQLTIPAGSATATFPVRTFAVAVASTATLQATSGSDSASVSLVVNPPSISSVVVSPARLTGGSDVTGTITLNGPAPSNPTLAIQLSSSLATVLLLPINLTAGSTSATFTMNTPPVPFDTQVTLHATLVRSDTNTSNSTTGLQDGSVRLVTNGTNATFTILAPLLSSFFLTPDSVSMGSAATGTVILTGRAPSSGMNVFVSTSSSEATVPSTLRIAGVDRQTFQIQAEALPPTRKVGITVSTQGSNPQVTTIQDGTSNTISVGESGRRSITANLSITPPPIPLTVLSITFAPSTVVGGANTTGTITLTGPALNSGAAVQLTFTSSGVLPQLVNVPAGSTSATFNLHTVPVGFDTVVNVSATLNASQDSSGTTVIVREGSVRTLAPSLATIKVLAPLPSTLLLFPPTVTGGTSSVGTVVLSSPAPPSGLVVGLSTGSPDVSVPSTLTIAAGLDRQNFNISTQSATTAHTVAINVFKQPAATGFTDGTSNTMLVGGTPTQITATLSITPSPPPIELFGLRPTTVQNGGNVIAQLKLASTAPASMIINLTTDHPELITMPSTVNVSRSPVATPFTFKTSTVSTQTPVTISATAGSQTISVTVNLIP